MSSTSQKHRNFVAEPMGNKPVTDLAGIGEVLGGRFEKLGFDKAYVVLGQFLVLKKNKEFFIDWMKDSIGANQNRQLIVTSVYQIGVMNFCEVVRRTLRTLLPLSD